MSILNKFGDRFDRSAIQCLCRCVFINEGRRLILSHLAVSALASAFASTFATFFRISPGFALLQLLAMGFVLATYCEKLCDFIRYRRRRCVACMSMLRSSIGLCYAPRRLKLYRRSDEPVASRQDQHGVHECISARRSSHGHAPARCTNLDLNLPLENEHCLPCLYLKKD
jgi:hypothetical protein